MISTSPQLLLKLEGRKCPESDQPVQFLDKDSFPEKKGWWNDAFCILHFALCILDFRLAEEELCRVSLSWMTSPTSSTRSRKRSSPTPWRSTPPRRAGRGWS